MKSLWVPIIACIVILLLIGHCAEAQAYCTKGEDGNWYTDEDPFVDAANHDFRLKPGSCAVDNGTDVGVKEDFRGVKRPQGNGFDIGAFELVLTDKLPPVTPEGLTLE
jgi:hypothetical protein